VPVGSKNLELTGTVEAAGALTGARSRGLWLRKISRVFSSRLRTSTVVAGEGSGRRSAADTRERRVPAMAAPKIAGNMAQMDNLAGQFTKAGENVQTLMSTLSGITTDTKCGKRSERNFFEKLYRHTVD